MPASQSSAADPGPRTGCRARRQKRLPRPIDLGDLALANRMVMAPMTRSRALDGNVPNPLAATYYVQRASAGLIMTEATQVSPQGVGYIRTPGIHSPEQVAGWRKRRPTPCIGAGGKIFVQLWHVGASRIPTSMAARCRSRRRRSRRTARSSPRRAKPRW